MDSLHDLLQGQPHGDALFEEQPDEFGAAAAANLFADDDEIRCGLSSPQSTLDRAVIGEERLDAVGMSADLQDDQLELESSVHGQFDR